MPALADTVEYIQTDALGTPIAVTDASGAVIQTSEYSPYGQVLNRAMADGPGYTGHVEDAATGLVYMQQRHYDPATGAMLSVDQVTAYQQPITNFCRYCYALGNPFAYVDPDGRDASDTKTIGTVYVKPDPPPSSSPIQNMGTITVTANRPTQSSGPSPQNNAIPVVTEDYGKKLLQCAADNYGFGALGVGLMGLVGLFLEKSPSSHLAAPKGLPLQVRQQTLSWARHDCPGVFRLSWEGLEPVQD